MRAMNNEIERPAHYDFGMMEAREIIELAIADFRDPTTIYHTASALKYLLRASRKNGADDIAKARKHIVWAEAAARAEEFRNEHAPSVRDAGEFTQPPNCSPGVSEPTSPMHAVALEMADEESPLDGITQAAYQTLVGN